MSDTPSGATLHQAAERAAGDPFFLGYVLYRYRVSERLGDGDLADRLGCKAEDIPRLALCRQPENDRFREDVEHLANRFGFRAGRLASILRQDAALEALRREPGESALLLAARDREDENSPPTIGDSAEDENSPPTAGDRAESD